MLVELVLDLVTGQPIDEPLVEDRELGTSLDGRRLLGIDPGGVHDWQLQELTPDGRVHLIALGTAADWAELDGVMTVWRPDTVVIDGAYDPTKVREFAAKWNTPSRRRVWVAWYGGNARAGIRWDETTGDVTADARRCSATPPMS